MKLIDEFRDAALARRLATRLQRITTQPWRIMEVCGGQTHAILRFGVDQLLPPQIELLHGPGCPVCVTPLELIEKALELAARPEVIFTSFGDMLRVPGLREDLMSVRARGGEVRTVYSPLDAVALAARHPGREVVHFAIGFETTAPANALAVQHAQRLGLSNFSLLVSHVLAPPAMEAILNSPGNKVQGFLAAGHVCTVDGYERYRPMARQYGVPVVVTGFEPVDVLRGVLACVEMLEEGRADVANLYERAVRPEGNLPARALVDEVFEVTARKWRGIGEIPRSGLQLRERYRMFDAEARFRLATREVAEPDACRSGLVLQGAIKPGECPAFGVRCTPERPLGATMVSSEGACAAYFRYRRNGMGTDE